MKRIFGGVYTAIITPFTKDNKIDIDAYRKLLDMQLENKVDGIVPCGTTGESPTLSHEEHDKLIELTVRHVKGRTKVIAGTGSNCTDEAIRLSRHAQEAGADAVLLVSPYYNKPTQKGLYLHFRAIADSIKIPVVVYNIKGRTGVNVETETLVRLMKDCKNILGVKEASGDIMQIKDVIKSRKDGFSVLSGDDNMAIGLIEAGGDGVISVASNILPGSMVRMVCLALKGNIREARNIERELSELFRVEFIETNPIPIKAMLAMKGMCKEIYRLPMCSLEKEEHRTEIKKALKQLGVI